MEDQRGEGDPSKAPVPLILGWPLWIVLIVGLIAALLACILVPILVVSEADQTRDTIRDAASERDRAVFDRRGNTISVAGGSSGVVLDMADGKILAGSITLGGGIGDVTAYLNMLNNNAIADRARIASLERQVANLTTTVNGLVGGSPFALVNGVIVPIGPAVGATLNMGTGDLRVNTGLTFRQIQAIVGPGTPTIAPAPTLAPVPTISPPPTLAPTPSPTPTAGTPFVYSVGGDWFFQMLVAPQTTLNTLTVVQDAEGAAQSITGFARFQLAAPGADWNGRISATIPQYTLGWNKIVIPFSNIDYIVGFGDCFSNRQGGLAGIQLNFTMYVWYSHNVPGNFLVSINQRSFTSDGGILTPIEPFTVQCSMFLLPEPKVGFFNVETGIVRDAFFPLFNVSLLTPNTPFEPRGFGDNEVSTGAQVYSVGGAVWQYTAAPADRPTETVSVMTVFGAPGQPQMLSGFVKATWTGQAPISPSLRAFISRDTPGWNAIVISNPLAEFTLTVGSCYSNYSNPLLPTQPERATSYSLTISYIPESPKLFFVNTAQVNGLAGSLIPTPVVMTCNIFAVTNPFPAPRTANLLQTFGFTPSQLAAINAARPPLGSLTQTLDPATTVQVFEVGDYLAFQFQTTVLVPYLTFNVLTLTTSADGTVSAMSSLMRLEYSRGTLPWNGFAFAIVPRSTPGWSAVTIPDPSRPALLSFGKCLANNTQPRPQGAGTTNQPFGTDAIVSISYSPANPNDFFISINQEVLVASQPPLAVPFFLECDLFVDTKPTSVAPPPGDTGFFKKKDNTRPNPSMKTM